MAIQLVPYNNSMRLGQGFNSFTQQICIDNAVVGISDSEDSQPLKPGVYAPIAGQNTTDLVVSDPTKKTVEEIADANGSTTIVRYPSQIVSYSSKYVSKLSDVSNELNVSGSLSIKYGQISGSGGASYVNTESFQKSDINFLVTVKVVNQTVNIKDQLMFWPLGGQKLLNDSTARAMQFMEVYGDSFISGFQEGGSFSAIVSITAYDSSKVTEIKANAQLALQIGIGSAEGRVDLAMLQKDLLKESEVNITINWSGGGQLKDNEKPWDIESLRDVAAKFPDLVANCPQRTHAILTKYSALRGYLQWKQDNQLDPLNYDLATLYTSELLDVYMGYKSIWKQIQEMLEDLDKQDDKAHALVKAPIPASRVNMPQVLTEETNAQGVKVKKWVDGPTLDRYDPNFVGLDLALRDCRKLMVRIVAENEEISKNPTLAVDVTRPIAYLRPQIFRQLLPVHAPSSPLNVRLDARQFLSSATIPIDWEIPITPQTVPPEVLLGFNQIDLDRTSKRQIARQHIFDRQSNNFKYSVTTNSLDNSAAAKAYSILTGTLVVPVNDEGIQAGIWNLSLRIPSVTPPQTYLKWSQKVFFKQAYDTQPPNVVVFLSSFDMETDGNPGFWVTAENVSTTSFDIVFQAVDTIRTATVSWFACPSDASNVACGTSASPGAATQFEALQKQKPQESFSDHVRFAPRVFANPPKVFVALRGFVADNARNIRVQVNATDITKKGFNWKVNGLADTKLLAASASWIVWQD